PAQVLGGDRIVEVAGVDRVDREGGELAEIAAFLKEVGPVPVFRFGRFLFDAIREAAAQALVEHEGLEHVARDVRLPDLADHPGAGLAAADQDDVADPAVALGAARQRDALAAIEQRLGHHQPAALGEHADDGIDRTPWRPAHFSRCRSTSSAIGSASSLAVFGLSTALTCALMPSFGSGSPSGR